MLRHELKTWPEFFQEVWTGRKKCEVRLNDRDFCVGDQLQLKEWDPKSESYMGREMLVRVDHILSEQPWCPEGYVIMSIEIVGLRNP